MPVVGHAFAGWTLASLGRQPRSPGATAVWLPLMLGLAYLPDLAAQGVLLLGWPAPTLATHSLVVAAAATPLIALGLHRLLGVPWWRAVALVGLSLAAHDLLDLLNSPERALFWPLSRRPALSGPPLLGGGLKEEVLWLGGAFALLALAWHAVQRGRKGTTVERSWRARGLGVALAMATALAAAGTAELRDEREDQIRRVKSLLAEDNFVDALSLLQRARRWPSTVDPGRVAYLEAEAHLGLGDRATAERLYLESYRDDPSYFWALADLTVFYAEWAAPATERRQLTARPYVERLEGDFATHEDLARVLTKVERALARD